MNAQQHVKFSQSPRGAPLFLVDSEQQRVFPPSRPSRERSTPPSDGDSERSVQQTRVFPGILCFRQRRYDPPYFSAEIFFLGVTGPYLAFLGSLLMWTYTYPSCPAYVYAWMLAILCLALGLSLHTWRYLPKSKKDITLQDLLPGFTHPVRNHTWGAFLLIMACGGCVFGRYNYYANMFRIVNLLDRQEYKDVVAGDDPSLYGDAGLIHFKKNSAVEDKRYRAFRYQGRNFCAAPILDGSSKYAGYFATGIDCCDDTFKCGRGNQGIVLPRHESRMFSPPDDHAYFALAAAAAAETFQLEIRETPIFVTLSQDAVRERDALESRVIGHTVLPALIGMFLCIVLSSALTIFFRHQMQSKK